MLLWAIALLVASLVFVGLEVTVPSGGLLSLLAGGSAIASVVFFFRVSTTWGVIGLLAVLILLPTAIAFAFKVWPHTPMGRRMILDVDEEIVEKHSAEREESRQLAQALIGARGSAVTDLRPVGVVLIEGERIDALAEGGVIPAGSIVRVTSAEGSQVKVRRVV